MEGRGFEGLSRVERQSSAVRNVCRVMNWMCGLQVCGVRSVPSVGVPQKNGLQVQRIRAVPLGMNTRFSSLTVRGQPAEQELVFNYEGEKTTVFPAEACEELGEEYCGAEGVGPEVKPKAEAPKEETAPSGESQEGVDREYEEYKGDKTVFPGEACDELGGPFCEPEYQKGVFPEKK
ncbi:hypothetical protein R1sor_019214 [Riccia sorocarpa]|uniref:Uncharacterized protein n=1 Tax=Riccia sorocarpa TaxID=122646 RepID=A0ABD3IC21_9MARC